MRRIGSSLTCLLLGLLPAVALSQGATTSTLSGKVIDGTGQALPGVTVSVRSPSLQGARSAVTSLNGDYILPALPPGDYTVTFDLSGFQKATQQVKLNTSQASRSDATLQLSSQTAEITVTGQKETISQGLQSQSTFAGETVEKLPTSRNAFTAAVALAPGVNSSGPSSAVTISGSQSYENLFLVNGVVVNENIRNQGLNLFIEEAVQETTTSTSGISAEYGRFGGGVISVVTKSGGNTFSGSFRTSLTNDAWSAITKYRSPTTGLNPENLIQKVNPTYEVTLGGPVIRDRIWFFGAGRSADTSANANTAAPVSLAIPQSTETRRYEGKLTFALSSRHSLFGTYQKIDLTANNTFFGTIYDAASLYTTSQPQELIAGSYSGTLTDNLFVEASGSQRKFTFEGSGSLYTDLIKGTLLVDNANGFRWWSPTFCGVCDDEKRDNTNFVIKASYFLSTKGAGSHNLVLGFDRFADKRFANNHQSGSDYRIYGNSPGGGIIYRDGTLYPRWTTSATGNSPTFIRWTPILQGSQGTDFVTNSIFLNDSWRVSSRITANIGVRWDKNDGADGSGKTVITSSKISPRLGMVYDVFGDGDLSVNAFYGRYVTAIANNQGDAGSIGGQPGLIDYDYRGPSINADPTAPTLVTTAAAIQQVFDWFFANGGTNRAFRGTPSVPGLVPVVGAGIDSPNTDEFTLGLTKRIGSRGLVRVDGVYRKSNDFYGNFTDLTRVTGGLGSATVTLDNLILKNTNDVERQYAGLNLNFSYRATSQLSVAGNWTWSHTYGSVDGETAASGPVAATVNQYPEYLNINWNAPVGSLATDRRHKVRAWVIYDVPLPWKALNLSASVLHNFDTGAPFGAIGAVDTRPFVTNPGYVSPPASVTYYFTARDAFRTDNINRTDVSLNLGLKPYKDIEVFLQPEVLNVFNRQGVISVNQAVQTRNSAGAATFAAFNPFTTVPTECTAPTGTACSATDTHWRKGPSFGTATGPANFQTPRFFRVSVGIRF